jgi:excisionase family DNA binding protein
LSNEDGVDRPGSEDDRWLSIEAACKLLGVDQSTLRRWSDSGKVPVFRTPGGHRRYSELAIRALLRGEQRPRRRMSRSVLTDLSMSAYEPDYLSQARRRPWYNAYRPAQLAELRVLGRRLVDLSVRAMSDSRPQDHHDVSEEGRRVGRRYGTISARAGLSATDTVEAFLFFRYPVFQAVARFIEEEALPSRRAARIFSEIARFTDEVLVSTMQAHSEAPESEPDTRS